MKSEWLDRRIEDGAFVGFINAFDADQHEVELQAKDELRGFY